MQSQKKTATKAQGASNATEQESKPAAAKAYTIFAEPTDDFIFDKLFDEIYQLIQECIKEATPMNANFINETQQKHAIYSILYVCLEKQYPYKTVLQNLQCFFHNIDPEYIMQACTNVYSNRFLTA
ncbi:MAG TPA: hypothetical protein PKK18_04150 [Chitinophagales bacterium]|nr:hypothetical protein [Chitinophagales bacterium]HMW12453.1 hypothetical protein [Chitinophagales bacterium]HMX59764.1 hypothetical protein [Chitinophagales bacterium]HMY22572.1 hypothetical protein [Chitinophagales bacterium]HMZ33420.1 hypothetical protein [Chitinophagales bacterium]